MVTGEVSGDLAGAGQGLGAEGAVQATTGGDQAQTEENSRAVREIVSQLSAPPL